MQIKILAFCGSSRRGSLNKQLLDIASLGAVDAGAQVSLIRWLDFPLPIYGGDWEAEHGLPERARALKALLAQYHALLIATSEHNGGYLYSSILYDPATTFTTTDPYPLLQAF